MNMAIRESGKRFRGLIIGLVFGACGLVAVAALHILDPLSTDGPMAKAIRFFSQSSQDAPQEKEQQ